MERALAPLNPFIACSTACRVQRSMKTTARTACARGRGELVATARRATCNPGRCGGRFGGSASSSTRAHAHTLKSTHSHTLDAQGHTETDPHAHARRASLGAVAGRGELQPSAQMRAEAGANKCTRGYAEVLAQTWAGASATDARAHQSAGTWRAGLGALRTEYLREYSEYPVSTQEHLQQTPCATRPNGTPTLTLTRTRAPARASGNGPLQSGVSGNWCPTNTPRGRRRWRAVARAVPGSRERASLPMDEWGRRG
jgi:hypothetical protein